MRMPLSPYHPMQIPLGLIIWSVWFVALYGGVAVACTRAALPMQSGPVSISFGFALFSLVAALLPGAFALLCWRAAREDSGRPARERFVARLGAAVHLTAVIAIVFIAIPLFGLPPCI